MHKFYRMFLYGVAGFSIAVLALLYLGTFNYDTYWIKTVILTFSASIGIGLGAAVGKRLTTTRGKKVGIATGLALSSIVTLSNYTIGVLTFVIMTTWRFFEVSLTAQIITMALATAGGTLIIYCLHRAIKLIGLSFPKERKPNPNPRKPEISYVKDWEE